MEKELNGKYTSKAEEILDQINDKTKLGDLRKIAKETKKDHDLAMQLWSSGQYLPRLLAILIMDKKELDIDSVNRLIDDMETHLSDQSNYLVDWFMANQLTKDKKLIAIMESWNDSQSVLKRRVFWYYQGRLRWTGKTDFDNTENLVDSIKENLEHEDPFVQWAMNFTAGWIGIYQGEHRQELKDLGKKIGLYKDDHVSPGCTPNYLPDFIDIEAKKRNQ